jgi:ABC-type nitrate/sulfonate/bicarbonate transport system ATPase subunit
MTVNKPKNTGSVLPFQARQDRKASAAENRRDNIIRMLDLSKFERPRPAFQDYGAAMRANIAAMVLLGLLVFLAKEDFGKLERSNLCAIKSECLY